MGSGITISHIETVECLYWQELAECEKSDHDYDDAEESRYCRYRGLILDVSDFTRIDPLSPLYGMWDGIYHTTYDSGFLIRLAGDEKAVIGSFFPGQHNRGNK